MKNPPLYLEHDGDQFRRIEEPSRLLELQREILVSTITLTDGNYPLVYYYYVRGGHVLTSWEYRSLEEQYMPIFLNKDAERRNRMKEDYCRWLGEFTGLFVNRLCKALSIFVNSNGKLVKDPRIRMIPYERVE